MAFVKKETKKEFKVGGVNIVMGQKYILDHKYDAGAPNGLKKIEATKFPFTGSGVSDCVAFDENKNLYDTGFYKQSNCLSHYSEEEKETWVPIYVNQIQKPYEEFRNSKLGAESQNDFWQSWRYDAYVNKEYDTNNPNELFELFQVIIQGVACEKNEKNPFYERSAQFTVSSPNITKNKAKEKTKARVKAINKLNILAEADKEKLDLVLLYIKGESTDKVSAEDLQLIYFEVINDGKAGLDFAEKFNNAIDKYETETGKEEMQYFHAVNELHKFRKIKKERRGFVSEDGIFLGNTLQDIAKFCVQPHTTQSEVIEKLIEENPKVRREVKK